VPPNQTPNEPTTAAIIAKCDGTPINTPAANNTGKIHMEQLYQQLCLQKEPQTMTALNRQQNGKSYQHH
jgi:hypothetical protein